MPVSQSQIAITLYFNVSNALINYLKKKGRQTAYHTIGKVKKIIKENSDQWIFPYKKIPRRSYVQFDQRKKKRKKKYNPTKMVFYT